MVCCIIERLHSAASDGASRQHTHSDSAAQQRCQRQLHGEERTDTHASLCTGRQSQRRRDTGTAWRRDRPADEGMRERLNVPHRHLMLPVFAFLRRHYVLSEMKCHLIINFCFYSQQMWAVRHIIFWKH